jgi:hypothetical protein
VVGKDHFHGLSNNSSHQNRTVKYHGIAADAPVIAGNHFTTDFTAITRTGFVIQPIGMLALLSNPTSQILLPFYVESCANDKDLRPPIRLWREISCKIRWKPKNDGIVVGTAPSIAAILVGSAQPTIFTFNAVGLAIVQAQKKHAGPQFTHFDKSFHCGEMWSRNCNVDGSNRRRVM